MPRLARVVAVDTAHHITQRGNNRRTVFESDSDRYVYLNLLQDIARRHRVSILGYCLMPNHLHLVVVPRQPDAMARVMRYINGRYAAYVNTRREVSGHLWQGRYYSCPMDDDHLWRALRYVERNPVRAGIAAIPEDYQWSSASVHCGDRSAGGLVDLGPWRDRWAIEEWRDYVDGRSAVEEAEVQAIRERTRSGRPLGSSIFVRELERDLGRPLSPMKGGRRPKVRQVTTPLLAVCGD